MGRPHRIAAGAWSWSRPSNAALGPEGRHDPGCRKSARADRWASRPATGLVCAGRSQGAYRKDLTDRKQPGFGNSPGRSRNTTLVPGLRAKPTNQFHSRRTAAQAARPQQIPIDPEIAPSPRAFLPWRLSDAGHRRLRQTSLPQRRGPHPKPFTEADIEDDAMNG